MLESLWSFDLFINTSISAMDTEAEIEYRLGQYYRLKPYCNSILRIVSCDFNESNPEGARMSKIQEELFNNRGAIDTVFRPSKDNRYVIDKIINTKKTKFLRSTVLASVYNQDAYLGRCNTCPDMCGLNL
jgi:hypothetical protein